MYQHLHHFPLIPTFFAILAIAGVIFCVWSASWGKFETADIEADPHPLQSYQLLLEADYRYQPIEDVNQEQCLDQMHFLQWWAAACRRHTLQCAKLR